MLQWWQSLKQDTLQRSDIPKITLLFCFVYIDLELIILYLAYV